MTPRYSKSIVTRHKECEHMAATKQLCLYITIVLTLVFARPRLWDRPPSETTAPGFVRDTPR